MATSLISHTVTDLSGTPLEDVLIRFTLEPRTAFRLSDESEIAPVEVVYTDSNGQISVALERTANITPDSVYQVFVDRPARNGGPSFHTIQVGSGNATLYESIVDSPPNPGLDVFLTQDIGDARYVRGSGTQAGFDILFATDYGAVGNTSVDSSTAINAAFTAAKARVRAALAAGVSPITLVVYVYLSPGRYKAKDLILPSFVKFIGPGVLVHADPGNNNANLIYTDIVQKSGTIANGAATVTLSDVTDVYIGALCVITGCTPDTHQATTIVNTIGSGDTSLTLASATGAGGGYWIIDSEIILFTVFAGAVITIVRGQFGTTPASHTAGTTISMALVGRAFVKSIAGNVVTLSNSIIPENDFACPRALTNTVVQIGSVNSGVYVDIDGAKLTVGGTNAKCIHSYHSVDLEVKCRVYNAPHSALFLESAFRTHFELDTFNCVSDVWFYQRAVRNSGHVRSRQEAIPGTSLISIEFDDRTSISTQYDDLPLENYVFVEAVGARSGADYTACVNVQGCENNTIEIICDSYDDAVSFVSPQQGTGSRGCKYNKVIVHSVRSGAHVASFDAYVTTTGNVLEIGGVSYMDSANINGQVAALANGNIIRGGPEVLLGELLHIGTALRFFGVVGDVTAVKQTVTGSRGGNAALASLLTKLATYNLITDSTTA